MIPVARLNQSQLSKEVIDRIRLINTELNRALILDDDVLIKDAFNSKYKEFETLNASCNGSLVSDKYLDDLRLAYKDLIKESIKVQLHYCYILKEARQYTESYYAVVKLAADYRSSIMLNMERSFCDVNVLCAHARIREMECRVAEGLCVATEDIDDVRHLLAEGGSYE